MTTPIANQDIIQKEPVVVTGANALDSVIGLIHDEHFELDDLTFSKDQGVVTIPYRRICHGHPGRLIRNWLICRTYELDVIRSILTIGNVQEYEVDDRSHIGTYSFNTMSYDNGSLLISCCEDCDLRMVTPRIEIESRDLGIRVSHGSPMAYSGRSTTEKCMNDKGTQNKGLHFTSLYAPKVNPDVE